jgi:hypothetical protein
MAGREALRTRRESRERDTVTELLSGTVDSFDREYWLAHCQGFRVDSPGGRLGFVDEVRAGREDDGGALLVVRAGLLGRRLLVIPTRDAAFIVPQVKRIWLRSTFTLVSTEPGSTTPTLH